MARVIARRAGRNYLVAAMAAVPLSTAEAPVDPAAAGFDPEAIASGVGEALSKYLDALPEREKARIRGLLTALAYAREDRARSFVRDSRASSTWRAYESDFAHFRAWCVALAPPAEPLPDSHRKRQRAYDQRSITPSTSNLLGARKPEVVRGHRKPRSFIR